MHNCLYNFISVGTGGAPGHVYTPLPPPPPPNQKVFPMPMNLYTFALTTVPQIAYFAHLNVVA